MRQEDVQFLCIRANRLPQEFLIKIEILKRMYWVCGQELCDTQSGLMIKLELATRNFEEYYCTIIVSPEEFEELILKQEKEVDKR